MMPQAPILTLFGEQVTKQFLSESLSGWDNFIFAMGPLGILTAVVSVIRVRGNSSLKAFIGRAQENPGDAEAELLSSTSATTAELWNNGGIARVFGSPKILEVVRHCDLREEYYDLDTIDPPKAGLYSFKEAYEKKIWMDKDRGHKLTTTPLVDVEASKLEGHKPNLSFNVGIRPVSEAYIIGAAVLGFMLQGGVLIYAGLAMYYFPKSMFEKNGKPMSPWAYPCTLAGTIMLCFGMFSCARIVEKRTAERYFRRGEGGEDAEIYWVQPGGQPVGDQIFEACALKGDPERNDYIISSLLDQNGKSWELWPLATVGITMCGFVLQFIGLRAMHSSVAMAQLGTALVMGIVRSALRAQRTRSEENMFNDDQRKIQGHELDCLAMKLDGMQSWQLTKPSKSLNYATPGASRASVPHSNLAVKVMKSKARLSQMTMQVNGDAWELDISTTAQRLRRTIEEVMNVLFADKEILKKDWKNASEFHWLIGADCQAGDGPSTDLVCTSMKRDPVFHDTPSASWQANYFDIEAVLGLWVWSIENMETKRPKPPYKRIFTQGHQNQLKKAKDDYKLWIQRTSDVKEDNSRSVQVIEQDDAQEDSQFYFGWPGLQRKSEDTALYVTQDSRHPPSNRESKEDLVAMCAQDIFLTFFGAATELIERIGGTTKPRGNNPTMDIELEQSMQNTDWDGSCFVLNSQLNKVSEVFVQNSLGSREEAYMCIIPILREKSKLPSLQVAHQSAKSAAAKLQETGNWEKAAAFLKWVCNSSDEETSKYVQAAEFKLGELYRTTMRTNINGFLSSQSSREDSRERDMQKFVEEVRRAAGGIKDMVGRDKATRMSQRYAWIAVQMLDESIPNDILQSFQRMGLNRYRDVISGYDEPNKHDLMHWVQQLYAAPSAGENEAEVDEPRADLRAVVLFLVGHKLVELNMYSSDRRTALSFAAENKDHDLLPVLLAQSDVALTTTDTKGWKPISYALQSGDDFTIDLFLERDLSYVNERRPPGKTPLMIAAESGHTKGLEKLLSKAVVNLEVNDDEHRTALHLATMKNHLLIVQRLLDKKAKIEAIDSDKCTPLLLAVEKDYIDMVTKLLDRGANIEAEDKDKRAPLLVAAKHGHREVVKKLLNNSANMESRDANGWTALRLAAEANHYEIVDDLLEERDVLTPNDVDGWESLLWAAKNGRDKAFKLLFDKHPNKSALIKSADRELCSALSCAVTKGHVGVVKVVVEARCELNHENSDGQTALYIAIQNNNESIAQLLIRSGARLNQKDSSLQPALSLCAGLGRRVILEYLLGEQSGKLVDVNSMDPEGQTPLLLAAKGGHKESAVLLLSHKNVEAKDRKWGQTPLSWAARNGHDHLIEVLICGGAEIESKSSNGKTPLSWGAENGRIKVVELLLEKMANAESKDVEERTPFMWAARNGHEEVVKLLFKRENLDLADCSGQTSLSLASERGHETVVRILLDRGALVNSRDTRWGRSPLFWAAKNGHARIVRLLLDHSADVKADVNCKDDKGWSPIRWVEKYGPASVHEILRSTGDR